MAFEGSEFVVPQLRWLGLRSSHICDIEEGNQPNNGSSSSAAAAPGRTSIALRKECFESLSEHDIARANSLVTALKAHHHRLTHKRSAPDDDDTDDEAGSSQSNNELLDYIKEIHNMQLCK